MPRTTPFLLLLLPLLLVSARPAETRARPERAVGRIAGSVEISAALTSRRPQFRIYSDTRSSVAPRIPANELTGELANVVLYLQADRGFPLPTADTAHTAVMAQMGERFDPRVLPVLQGAQVDFPNYDDVYHNVFSLSRARTFDLGRYPKGSSKSIRFQKPGVVQVFCHIHGDMSAVVLVLAHSYYAAPDSLGRYVIDDVPVGEYTLVGWHERTKPVLQTVRVTAGETATVNFKLPLGSSTGQ